MKSTGVIRRIDELGRIVIPKEIRRNLGIRDGENLEIYVEEDRLILKKYSKLEDLESIVKEIGYVFNNIYNNKIIITDREKVIYSNLDNINNLKIDKRLISLIQNRESVLKNSYQIYNFDREIKGYFLIVPIITSVDCLGLVLVYNENSLNDEDINLIKFIASLISKKIDIA